MALYEQWKQLAQMAQTPQQQQAFWDDYFAAEADVYEKILDDTSIIYEGTEKKLPGNSKWIRLYLRFIDGINTSLKKKSISTVWRKIRQSSWISI